MQKLLYVLLGLALFNTSALLADPPAQQTQQTVDDSAAKDAPQSRDDDC